MESKRSSVNSSRISSRSRISSQESSLIINQRGHDRHRSPSPSEFNKNRLQLKNNLWIREQEMNEFIRNGIQKFLDKQAVRDLINAYDEEEIFINEKDFFENMFDDQFQEIDSVTNQSLTGSVPKKNPYQKFSQLLNIYATSLDGNKLTKKEPPVPESAEPNKVFNSPGSVFSSVVAILTMLFNLRSKRNKVHQQRNIDDIIDIMERF